MKIEGKKKMDACPSSTRNTFCVLQRKASPSFSFSLLLLSVLFEISHHSSLFSVSFLVIHQCTNIIRDKVKFGRNFGEQAYNFSFRLDVKTIIFQLWVFGNLVM